MYVELVEKSIKNRGNIVPVEQLSTAPRDFEAYVSHFPFSNDVIDYVKLKGSISGYSGKQFCRAFVIDVDNADLYKSYESTRTLIDRLVTEYGCPSEMIDIAFSGSKGFHLTLSEQLFGKFTEQVGISEKIRELVRLLAAGIDDVDLSIYDATRIIRIKNSVNTKSGLYKIPLTLDDFLKGVDTIKLLAEVPRMIKPTKKAPVHKLIELWLNLKEPDTSAIKVEADADGFFSPPPEGNRNNQIFKQACYLFDYSQLTDRQVSEIVLSINAAATKPLTKAEVNAIIASAKTKTGAANTRVQAFTLDELLPEWFDYMKPENQKLTFLDPDFDAAVNGKFRGKMIPIVGYPGTKKSLFALGVAAYNMSVNGCRTIYSNMEMSASELINRAIDVRFDSNEGLASQEVERQLKDDQEQAISLYKSICSEFGNRMYVCNDSMLTAKDYEMLIYDVEAKAGKVDFLIVDGLSMMGGTGTDTERINKHTAELKALANKTGVCVIPIVHLSKGLEYHSRELMKNARDSQKIADNGDYFLMLSMCVDTMKDGEETEYVEDLVYARFWAKRGTGRRVSKIFEFAKNTLRLVTTPYDPKLYDAKKNKKQKMFD